MTPEEWRAAQSEFYDLHKRTGGEPIHPTAKLSCGLELQEYCMLEIRRDKTVRDARAERTRPLASQP